MKKALLITLLLLLTCILPTLPLPHWLPTLWPALCALSIIVFTKNAALGLGCGVLAGALLLHPTNPPAAVRTTLTDFIFPALEGPWHIGAILFTLILGAFAGLLEKSGAFQTIFSKLLKNSKHPKKRLLNSVYLLGLLCFFDGLANSLLTGRIARPLADKTGISRERLAWIVDSTSSPVACVAFISTWIATQLSLISSALKDAPFPTDPYSLFFSSIPANPYCLLTLILIPVAIASNYQPRAMRTYPPQKPVRETPSPSHPPVSPLRAIIPLLTLIIAVLLAFPLLSNPVPNLLSLHGWRTAFSGDSGPYALVTGSIVGLTTAWLLFPKNHTHTPSSAALQGAANLLPALLILILAWSLGNVFSTLGAASQIASLLTGNFPILYMPLATFLSGACISFATGSSWGTMGLLMPLALPATLATGLAANLPPQEIATLIPSVIGAVFGGAVLGDHCSPFSDTTIVSSLATGCTPTAHVHSQLPFAALTAAFSILAYTLIALHITPLLATTLAAIALITTILILSKTPSPARK